MRTVGIITTWIVGLTVLGGVVLGIRSMNDVKRYIKMKAM